MAIDFGKVERYVEDMGFGFVSHTFANIPPKEVFFHIKVVKRTYPDLAQALDNITTEKVYFWYEYMASSKGQEVLVVLDLKQIRQKYAVHQTAFNNTIKTSWMNVREPLPESLKRATSDLLTSDEVNQLTASRFALQAEHRRDREKLQNEESARQQAIADQRAAVQREKAARQLAIADQQAIQQREEEKEFYQLLAEMSAQRFTHSRQVSEYIVSNKLGYKYKHISGILQMRLDGNVWNSDGGFPPSIYKRLCHELRLQNQGSRAVPVAFTLFKDII